MVVDEDQCRHGINDRQHAGEYGAVVATGDSEIGGVTIGVYRRLRASNGGDGLEGGAEADYFPIGDAALDASRVVGRGSDFALLISDKRIIGLCSPHLSEGKAVPDLKALGGIDAHHC